jgi:hypothetical protein
LERLRFAIGILEGGLGKAPVNMNNTKLAGYLKKNYFDKG